MGLNVHAGPIDEKLFGEKGFQELRAIQPVRPNFDLAHGRAGEGQHLKGKNHSLEKKLITAAATEDHHPIGRIAIGAVLGCHKPCRGGKGHI